MPRRRTEVRANSEVSPTTARSAEAREAQIIAAAYDLAEQRIRDGSASDTLVAQFIKYGSRQSRLELEVTELQKDLVKARTEAYKSAQRSEELFTQAMDMLKVYTGDDDDEA